MPISQRDDSAPWLLLTFTLPAKRASQRVEVWRKVQRYGAIPLGNSGYLVPNNPATQERFEWLATAIRKYAGEASVVKVQAIDNLTRPRLVARFTEARNRDYQELLRALQKASSSAGQGGLSRLRTRFREIAEVDFFQSPLQKRVEEMLARADGSKATPAEMIKINPREYLGRTWVTRPRPGIDRSASAWLIRRFIDKKARFTFAAEEHVPAHAVPFDMFHGAGFSHRGEDCTFETLQKSFRIHEKKAAVIGQMIHDADLLDGKFGRKEGFGIDEVLRGWAKRGVANSELLKRGIELVEALYQALGGG